jgi:hypothetical protein
LLRDEHVYVQSVKSKILGTKKSMDILHDGRLLMAKKRTGMK